MERPSAPSKLGPHETVTENLPAPPIEKQYRVPDGYVNRQMLRDLTGATEHELKSLEGQRLIKAAMKNGYGWRLYAKEQIPHVRLLIEQLRSLREAQKQDYRDASSKLLPIFRAHPEPYSLAEYEAVIEALSKQTEMTRVPIVTRIHPSIVNIILRDSGALSGALYVDKSSVDKINALALPGDEPINSVDSLIRVMKLLLKLLEQAQRDTRKDRKCEICQRDPRSACKGCMKRALEQVVDQLQGKTQSPSPAESETTRAAAKRATG